MEIRLLTRDDAEAFRTLRLAALEECPTAFTADHAAQMQKPLAHFAAQIQSMPDNFIIGAFAGRTLSGMAGFYRSEGPKLRHKGNIWGMYIAPARRGTGAGRKILLDVIGRARSLEAVVQIHLTVVAGNARARKLYLDSGFTVTGREPRAILVDGTFYDDEPMVLQLRP